MGDHDSFINSFKYLLNTYYVLRYEKSHWGNRIKGTASNPMKTDMYKYVMCRREGANNVHRAKGLKQKFPEGPDTQVKTLEIRER